MGTYDRKAKKKMEKGATLLFVKKNFGTRIVMGLLNLDHNQKKKTFQRNFL